MDRRAAKSSSSFFNSSRLFLKAATDSSTSCSRLIRSFLKPPISSSTIAFSVIPEALFNHELLDKAGRLVNRGIADLEQLHQAVDQLLLRSEASENVVVAGEGLHERRLVAMADVANALVRSLAFP